MIFVAIKGATAWEMQVGRVWVAVRYPSFWRNAGLGWVRIVPKETN